MQAILIDPEMQFIASLSVDSDDYERIRQVIGCASLTVAANLSTHDTVLVGRATTVNGTPCHFFRVAGCKHPIAGRAVFVGSDHVGDSVDAHTSAQALRESVTYEHTAELANAPHSRFATPTTRTPGHEQI